MWHVVQQLVLTDGGDGGGVIPNGPPSLPPGLGPLMGKMVSWGKGIVIGAGMIGFLICAGMIILGRRNRGQMAIEGVIGSAWVLGGLALAGAAVALVGAFAI
jgi:hypothetical protein